MTPKWELFDKFRSIDKQEVVVRWICYGCKKVCVVELPPRKNIYHCLKDRE